MATVFGMPAEVLESWLLGLNTVRNICAHHSRLWNRELGIKPKIPRAKDYPAWHAPVAIGNSRMFGIMTICNYCLTKLAPHSRWSERVQTLLGEFPEVPTHRMGFPVDWLKSPLWQTA